MRTQKRALGLLTYEVPHQTTTSLSLASLLTSTSISFWPPYLTLASSFPIDTGSLLYTESTLKIKQALILSENQGGSPDLCRTPHKPIFWYLLNSRTDIPDPIIQPALGSPATNSLPHPFCVFGSEGRCKAGKGDHIRKERRTERTSPVLCLFQAEI